jgi:ubiquinone/menaquinone biosynthesis C-methylase UbiE
MQKKINIGAGSRWFKDGWEILDNGSGKFKESWQHYGNMWDSKLPSNEYDIVYTSQTLEHVPHFKNEQTIAEFNRILKVGGLVRISVPDLRKAANAYINNEINFFKGNHFSDHLGIGGLFVNRIISPGNQTLALNRGFNEIIGSYAHLYAYDCEMLKILLKKWGFGDVAQTEYCKSSVKELREKLTIVYNNRNYSLNDESARNKLKSDTIAYYTGFDHSPHKSLFVEAKKFNNESYKIIKEYKYNRRNRLEDDKLIKIKLLCFYPINTALNILHRIYLKMKS